MRNELALTAKYNLTNLQETINDMNIDGYTLSCQSRHDKNTLKLTLGKIPVRAMMYVSMETYWRFIIQYISSCHAPDSHVIFYDTMC